MNYMTTVPYYQTVPEMSAEHFDLAMPHVPYDYSLATHLSGFKQKFDMAYLQHARFPLAVADWAEPAGSLDSEMYVLRLPVRVPGGRFHVPVTLRPIEGLLNLCESHFRANTNDSDQMFCYVTIRCGERVTTDTTWHVDGFQAGLRQTLKVPEVNYLWADSCPTEFFEGSIDLTGLDPTIHNVHTHLHHQIERGGGKRMTISPGCVYAMNPYMPHRKPSTQGFRRFVRVTFSAAEIQDDTCSYNPALPMPRYDNEDVRWRLKDLVSQ